MPRGSSGGESYLLVFALLYLSADVQRGRNASMTTISNTALSNLTSVRRTRPFSFFLVILSLIFSGRSTSVYCSCFRLFAFQGFFFFFLSFNCSPRDMRKTLSARARSGSSVLDRYWNSVGRCSANIGQCWSFMTFPLNTEK